MFEKNVYSKLSTLACNIIFKLQYNLKYQIITNNKARDHYFNLSYYINNERSIPLL